MSPASAQDHRQWAQDNETFYDAIGGSGSQWPAWAMTAVFYVALHEVRACFLDNGGIRLGAHDRTRVALRKNLPRTQILNRHYTRLYDWSVRTRYKGWRPSQAELQRAEQSLRQIRSEIARLNAQAQPLVG